MLFELFTHVRKVGFTGFEGMSTIPQRVSCSRNTPSFSRTYTPSGSSATRCVRFPRRRQPPRVRAVDGHGYRSPSQEESQAIGALSTVADSLPGLGIVAAVLGVVITMGALGGPPEEIGHKVAAALVAPFWAFCCVTASLAPSPKTSPKSVSQSRITTVACSRRWWRSPKAWRRF